MQTCHRKSTCGPGVSARRLVASLSVVALLVSGCGKQSPPSAAPSAQRAPQQVQAERQVEPPARSLPAQVSAQASVEPVGTGALPVYELKMDAANLRRMESSIHSDTTYPTSFKAGDAQYPEVQIRYRGAWARFWPKKPLKIFFPKERPFEGRRVLNLNSGWRDPAYVREVLAYHVYRACGVPASRSSMAVVNVNGQFHGLYVEVEQPDKAFLKRNGLAGATLIKANSKSNRADERDLGNSTNAYRVHYEVETQKETGLRELMKFCQGLQRATDVEQFFNQQVDLDRYINYLAATTLLQHWDSYNKNHFIVYDGGKSKKWFLVPWDLDRTMGDHWNWNFEETNLSPWLGTEREPGVTGWNRMADRFFSSPALKARYVARLKQLLETEFTPDKLFPVLDAFEQQIEVVAKRDRARWPGTDPDLKAGIQGVKNYITKRRGFLLGELARLK